MQRFAQQCLGARQIAAHKRNMPQHLQFSAALVMESRSRRAGGLRAVAASAWLVVRRPMCAVALWLWRGVAGVVGLSCTAGPLVLMQSAVTPRVLKLAPGSGVYAAGAFVSALACAVMLGCVLALEAMCEARLFMALRARRV